MYVVAKNIYEGIMEINSDGSFNRYTGVNPIQMTPLEIFTRSLMSEEQIAQLQLYLPTEYTNVTIDDRNLAKIKGNEKKYLEILYELIDHKMLDFYVVDDRNLPQIEIGREVVENQYYPVKVNYPEPEKRRITGIRDLNAVSVKIEEVYQAHPLCEIKP